MAAKGQPKSGGRKKGSINKRSKELADLVNAEGLSMAEIMVGAARSLWTKAHDEAGNIVDHDVCERAGEMAVKAAPYFHPRLSAISHTGQDGKPLFDLSVLSDEQLAALKSLLTPIVRSGAPAGASRH